MSVTDLLHENHVAMLTEFKAWTSILRVRSEQDLDFDLREAMWIFDGFNNISYQCLNKEEIECEEKVVENTLRTVGKVTKKNDFSLITSSKRAFIEERRDQFEQKR